MPFLNSLKNMAKTGLKAGATALKATSPLAGGASLINSLRKTPTGQAVQNKVTTVAKPYVAKTTSTIKNNPVTVAKVLGGTALTALNPVAGVTSLAKTAANTTKDAVMSKLKAPAAPATSSMDTKVASAKATQPSYKEAIAPKTTELAGTPTSSSASYSSQGFTEPYAGMTGAQRQQAVEQGAGMTSTLSQPAPSATGSTPTAETPSATPTASTAATATPSTPSLIDQLRGKVSNLSTASERERALQDELARFQGDARMGISGLEGQGRGIPLELIRGQQSKLAEQANIQQQTLMDRIANEAAQRQLALQAAQTELGYVTQDQARMDQLTAPTEVGGSLLQYDPATGTYKTLYSAPTTPDTDRYASAGGAIYDKATGEIVSIIPDSSSGGYGAPDIQKINGVDYQWNSSTGAWEQAATPTSDATVSDLTKQAASLIGELSAMPGLEGNSGALKFDWVPGSDSANFKAKLDQVKALLSLDNIKYLKGTGAISDKESALLSSAATSLNSNMSEGAFRQELSRLNLGLTAATNGYTDEDVQYMKSNKMSDDQIIKAMKENPQSFSQDLSTSQNGSPLEIAKSYIGLNASNPKQAQTLSAFFKKAGGLDVDPAKTAWCAAFLNSVLGASGIKGTGSLLAQSFLKFGTAVDKPSKGDIVVFERGPRGGWQGHVGIVAGVNSNGTLQVLGGNQDGGANVQTFSTDRVLGYRRINQTDVKNYTAQA